MDQPTPKKPRSDWPVVVMLCVTVIVAGAVCALGMLLYAGKL